MTIPLVPFPLTPSSRSSWSGISAHKTTPSSVALLNTLPRRRRLGKGSWLKERSTISGIAAPACTSAVAVWSGDEEIDAVNNSLLRELLTYMIEDPRNIGICIHLMFCIKNIERMGDHATNIAEIVYFMVEGKMLPDDRPKGDITTSISAPIETTRKNS